MTGNRGTGRTYRGLEAAYAATMKDGEPRVVFYVVGPKMDDYCFELLTKIVGKVEIRKFSRAHHEVVFVSGGRIRLLRFNDPNLVQTSPGYWHVLGYRHDLPIYWDHQAEDLWSAQEAAKVRAAKLNR